MADTSIQDEGGDPNSAHVETKSKKTKSTLEPVKEGEVTEFTDQFDLKDENAWVSSVFCTFFSEIFLLFNKVGGNSKLFVGDYF